MTCLYQFLTRDEDIYVTQSCGDLVAHYGAEVQKTKLAEECSEYAAARIKNVQHPSQAHEAHELEELADVIVMLEQRISMMKAGEGRLVAEIVMEKIHRQQVRINQEEDAASHRDIEHGC